MQLKIQAAPNPPRPSNLHIHPQIRLSLRKVLLLDEGRDLVEHELFLVNQGALGAGFEILGGRGEGCGSETGGVVGGVV
jgi:hypothetical protein